MVEVGAFVAECEQVLGEANVRTDADVTAGQSVDWTGRWRGTTPAVLRPHTSAEVVAVVRAARRHRVALVPQGGNTGLVGGSVPHAGEVVLDLRRLDRLEPVDAAAAQVTVGAGATLAAVQAHVAPAGLAVGVDLAARDSATIGGMVATNAGGMHVLRHGSMRAQVVGLEAVLGTGELVAVNLAGLLKDNTGYDLAGLLCGSEGTLGVVTAARLRLVPAPRGRLVALLALADVGDAVRALPVLRALPDLHAVELVLASGTDVVAAHLGLPAPLPPAATCGLLVELAAEGDASTADLVDQLGGALDALGGAIVSTAVAEDDAGQARLWRWREAHSEAAAGLGLVHKADITIPISVTERVIAAIGPAVEAVAPGATTLVYGHLGDGNLHVNVVGPAADDGRAVDAVLELVLAHGGSVSAEHGIGVAKRAWLERQRGSAAVAAMRSIKEALDPDGILNPGVLLP
jgi:FAD/FMN-containing dehydrogenase